MSDKDNQNHGFRGLGSLADEAPKRVTVKKTTGTNHKASGTDSRNTGSSERDRRTAQTTTTSSSARNAPESGDDNSAAWVIGAIFAGVLLLAFVGEQLSDDSAVDQTDDYPSSTSYDLLSDTDIPSATSARSASGYESLRVEKPPTGRNRVLGISQIRWCIREELRIETLANWGNDYVDSHNTRVDNYNSRCAEFRYRVGNLSRARTDVSKYRSQIIAELESRYSRSTTPSRASESTSTRLGRAEIREIQSRLNERGFGAGREDGLMGPNTANAIRDYQKRANIPVTGRPSKTLIESLRTNKSIKQERSSSSNQRGASQPSLSENEPAVSFPMTFPP
ncbi:peptidoglycan-binding domain-containing protein [Salinisphaera sp. P385]|uniref:Peptidoglycan-binding domain-containing protein n=1 Tax=Spectribacter acetivorans TaxID=3075603 RepID=A0ABU3BBS9_9GAMM|nr:peptidoglycan-binding domain-containing protein [Salinisphaera sp. P385]MDT0619942.1 peptidoglycan-binding domain-containing protein [Salinisphaera sp. P385]